MTVQVQSTQAGKSKATLLDMLTTKPQLVGLYDPSIFPGSRGYFTGADIKPGESFTVVMDPNTRRRFATVMRKADGKFGVK